MYLREQNRAGKYPQRAVLHRDASPEMNLREEGNRTK